MPAPLLALIEVIVYAAARGAVRGYLDVLSERGTHVDEKVTDEDRARADRLRDAVRMLPPA
jgi:hypothetical protein